MLFYFKSKNLFLQRGFDGRLENREGLGADDEGIAVRKVDDVNVLELLGFDNADVKTGIFVAEN